MSDAIVSVPQGTALITASNARTGWFRCGSHWGKRAFNTLCAIGTWDGATISLYYSPDGTDANAIALGDVELSDDGIANFQAAGFFDIRISGGGGSDEVAVWVN